MSTKKNKTTTAESATKTTGNPNFVFGKKNYRLLAIGIGVLALGFILMMGKENILDFRKITLAPIVMIAGFITIGVAILTKPDEA